MADDQPRRGVIDTIKDALGMNSADEPAMDSGDELRRDADTPTDRRQEWSVEGEPETEGGERAELEGMAGIAGAQRDFGGMPANPRGPIASDVTTENEEGEDVEADTGDTTDPRGY